MSLDAAMQKFADIVQATGLVAQEFPFASGILDMRDVEIEKPVKLAAQATKGVEIWFFSKLLKVPNLVALENALADIDPQKNFHHQDDD